MLWVNFSYVKIAIQWPSPTTIASSTCYLWNFPVMFNEGVFSFNATIQAIKTSAINGPYYSYCNWAGMKIETTSSCYLTSRTPSLIDEGDVIISALVLGI